MIGRVGSKKKIEKNENKDKKMKKSITSHKREKNNKKR